LFITPLDVLAINIILPFFNGGETLDVFKKVIAQVDLHFDFGNIALTYVGGLGYKDPEKPFAYQEPASGPDSSKDNWAVDNSGNVTWKVDTGSPGGAWKLYGGSKGYDDPPKIFLYYGGEFGPIGIDFGFSYQFASADGDWANPINIGLGVKYGADSFGIKFRAIARLAGDDKATRIRADVLPYFNLSDNLAAFISVGLGVGIPDKGDNVIGWHFNPYLQVGEEWGAKFLAGIKVWSGGKADVDAQGNDGIIHWAVPIALIVSF